MTLAILLVVLAVLSLIFIIRFAVLRSLRKTEPSRIQPVDIDAFRNLVDAVEHEYLRSRLSPHEFRHVQRKRLLAAAAYIRVVAANAALLMIIGESALASPETEHAQAARKMIDDALILRRNATLALARIYIALIWPDARFFYAGSVLDSYRRLNGSAMLLGRLQNPAANVRGARS